MSGESVGIITDSFCCIVLSLLGLLIESESIFGSMDWIITASSILGVYAPKALALNSQSNNMLNMRKISLMKNSSLGDKKGEYSVLNISDLCCV